MTPKLHCSNSTHPITSHSLPISLPSGPDMTTRIHVLGLIRSTAPRLSSSSTARLPARATWRYYATHSDRVPPSGSSSHAQGQGQSATTDSTAELLRRLEAESRRQGGASGFGGRESVGPFPLGVGPSGRRKIWRPWGELGVSGKCESALCPAWVFEDTDTDVLP